MDIKIARGVKDYFGNDMNLHSEIVQVVSEIFEAYGYSKIKTPIFEDTNLFKRSVGEGTDIVNKEMYTFEDRKGRSLTLRPELTAPVVRSYLENKMYGSLDNFNKFYYYGEAFRYERAQAGRYRQFHQLGVEVFNIPSITIDLEVIQLANQIINVLELEKYTTLKLNSIGSVKEREIYVTKLKEYFNPNISKLCSDCQKRIETNPLRILDCKIDGENEIVVNAPKINDYLNEDTNNRFNKITKYLDEVGIKYEIDSSLVRGLDYYNDTVFEFVFEKDNLSFTIIAGGRYDKLVSQLSNQDIPAFGFGTGVERLAIAMESINKDVASIHSPELDVYFAPLKEERNLEILKAMNILRNSGIKCEMNYMNKSIKHAFKEAETKNALYIVIADNEEKVRVKNLQTKEEAKVKLEEFIKDIVSGSEHE